MISFKIPLGFLRFTVFFPLIFLCFCSQEKMPLNATSDESENVISSEYPIGEHCPDIMLGQSDNGAYYLIEVPDNWNGDLIIYAPAYIPVTEPLAIPRYQLYLPDGTYFPDLVCNLGYAFATTSYRYTGFISGDAVSDLIELAEIFQEAYGVPIRTYLLGASQGAHIAVKAMETSKMFDGSLVICGPIGSMLRQINLIGDIRVIFDFYFPGILPGDVKSVPEDAIANWETVYLPRILAAFRTYPERYRQFLNVINLPADPNDPENSVNESAIQLLWANVIGTNDLAEKLGGHPYDNTTTIYSGSDDDEYLNTYITRFSSDITGLLSLHNEVETTGNPHGDIISMFNTDDPFVKPLQALIYRLKTFSNQKTGYYTNVRVKRYGHCNFSPRELLGVFKALVLKVTLRDLFDLQSTEIISSAFEDNETLLQ